MPSADVRDEEALRKLFERVRCLAQGLGDGSLPFIDTVRELSSLRFQVTGQDNDPDFIIFVAIASETDHLPPLRTRELCSPAWRKRCDLEAHEVESFYRIAVRSACGKLVERFSALLARPEPQSD